LGKVKESWRQSPQKDTSGIITRSREIRGRNRIKRASDLSGRENLFIKEQEWMPKTGTGRRRKNRSIHKKKKNLTVDTVRKVKSRGGK